MKRFLFLFLITLGCSHPIDDVIVTQSESKYPVVFGLYQNNKKYGYIELFNQIKFTNTSYVNSHVRDVEYYSHYLSEDNRFEKTHQMRLWSIKNDTLEYTHKPKIIWGKKSITYIYSVRFPLDTSNVTQQYVKSFFNRANIEHKDTIHLGLLTTFKRNNHELFTLLTNNDSIHITYITGQERQKRTITIEEEDGTSKHYTYNTVRLKFKTLKTSAKW